MIYQKHIQNMFLLSKRKILLCCQNYAKPAKLLEKKLCTSAPRAKAALNAKDGHTKLTKFS